MKRVIIYPGRFQPMLPHHAQVYNTLVANNPESEVYIATSNKVEDDKSPFDFSEKKSIMVHAHGIDPEKILQVRSPYSGREYERYFDPENTALIFAVGEKDMQEDPRFEMEPDPDTGLNLKKDGEPSWLQMINTDNGSLLPMSQRGYLVIAPTVNVQGKVASSSKFRSAMKSAVDEEHAKQVFKDFFGTFNQALFNKIYKKLEEQFMNDNINELRKLAGLPLTESDSSTKGRKMAASNNDINEIRRLSGLPLMEGAPVKFGMNDVERKLADIGRLLMDAGRDEKDPEMSRALSELGAGLAEGWISTMEDMKDFIMKLDDEKVESALAKEVTDVFARYNAGERAEVSGDEPEMDGMDDEMDDMDDDMDFDR